MAQYRVGTVSVTNNSSSVVGTGTSWLTSVAVGDLFAVPGDNALYTVASVNSDTSIQLSAPYAGTTNPTSTYAIVTDFTPILNIPFPVTGDIETAAIVQRAVTIIETAINADSGKIFQVTFDAGTDGISNVSNSRFDTILPAAATIIETSITCYPAPAGAQTLSAKVQVDGVGVTATDLDLVANAANTGAVAAVKTAGSEPDYEVLAGQRAGFLLSSTNIPAVTSCTMTMTLKKA